MKCTLIDYHTIHKIQNTIGTISWHYSRNVKIRYYMLVIKTENIKSFQNNIGQVPISIIIVFFLFNWHYFKQPMKYTPTFILKQLFSFINGHEWKVPIINVNTWKKLIFLKNILALHCGINETLHNSKRKTLIKTSKIRVKMSNRDWKKKVFIQKSTRWMVIYLYYWIIDWKLQLLTR